MNEFPWNTEIYLRKLIVDNNNNPKICYAYRRDLTNKSIDDREITEYRIKILDIHDDYVINDIKNGRL